MTYYARALQVAAFLNLIAGVVGVCLHNPAIAACNLLLWIGLNNEADRARPDAGAGAPEVTP